MLDWHRRALGLDAAQAPFLWQVELLRRFRQGEVVSSLDIPTGLGKTAVMAVWLVARVLGVSLPRRLCTSSVVALLSIKRAKSPEHSAREWRLCEMSRTLSPHHRGCGAFLATARKA